MRTRFEHSAGGVLSRGAGEGLEVVLAARRRRSGELVWGLPKGLVEAGEEPAAAALREVREETGLEAVISESLGDISYFYVWEGERVRKKVTFFLMAPTGGDLSLHDDEMEEVRWFPFERARRSASFASEREILERAATALRGASPLH